MPRKPKPVYDFVLDDGEDELTEEDLDLLNGETPDVIYDKYMEDISEILARAYEEISIKVRQLMEVLEK